MGNGILRNQKCWCGSGLKFKKCHANRAAESPVPTSEKLKAYTKATDHRACMHPDASSECSGPIIKAHTIQRAGGLSKIARDGHVYTWPMHPADHLRKKGHIRPLRTGVAKATTFTGFCARHDSQLFSPLETVSFSGNAQQVFLLAYRAVCKEVYAKLGDTNVMAFGKTLDRGLPIEHQIAVQYEFGIGGDAASIGLRDIMEHKKRLDKVLQAGDFSAMHALIIEVVETPSFLCSGAIAPEYDFSGHALQNLWDVQQILELVTFSLIATDTGGAVVFAWLDAQRSAENLCNSLESMLDKDLPDAVARFTFEFFENVAMAPDWWESLSREVQERLTLRFMTQTGAEEFQRSPTCLSPDGVHSVAWTVTSRRRM